MCCIFSPRAAWLGGLVSLALLFAAVRRRQRFASTSLAVDAAHRIFSTLGIVCVATLFGVPGSSMPGSGRLGFERCLSPSMGNC